MKKEALTAVFLTAVLTLSGCGIYTSAARSRLPNEPVTNPVVSLPEESKQEPVAPAPVEPAPIEPAPVKPVTPEPAQPSAAARLTKAEAEAIALKHAGFTAGQVKGLRSEYDFDDGVARYEVEFRVGQWEYDYDVHAESGKILSFEKDD